MREEGGEGAGGEGDLGGGGKGGGDRGEGRRSRRSSASAFLACRGEGEGESWPWVPKFCPRGSPGWMQAACAPQPGSCSTVTPPRQCHRPAKKPPPDWEHPPSPKGLSPSHRLLRAGKRAGAQKDPCQCLSPQWGQRP